MDAIEVLRAARVASAEPPNTIVFVGGDEVARAATYLDAWIQATRPEPGRMMIARPGAGALNVVLAGPVARRWEDLLGG